MKQRYIPILFLAISSISFFTQATNNTDIIPYFPEISTSEQSGSKFARTIYKKKYYLIIKDKNTKNTTWLTAKLPKPKYRIPDFTSFAGKDYYNDTTYKIKTKFEELIKRKKNELRNFPEFTIHEDNKHIVGYTMYKNKVYLVKKDKKDKKIIVLSAPIKKPTYRNKDFPGLKASSPLKAFNKKINIKLKEKGF